MRDIKKKRTQQIKFTEPESSGYDNCFWGVFIV